MATCVLGIAKHCITKEFQDLSGISAPRNSLRTLPPQPGPWHSIASPVNRTQLHFSFRDNTPVIINSHLPSCIFHLEDNEIILSIQASRVSVLRYAAHLGTESELPLETWCSLSVPRCAASNNANWYSWYLYTQTKQKQTSTAFAFTKILLQYAFINTTSTTKIKITATAAVQYDLGNAWKEALYYLTFLGKSNKCILHSGKKASLQCEFFHGFLNFLVDWNICHIVRI